MSPTRKSHQGYAVKLRLAYSENSLNLSTPPIVAAQATFKKCPVLSQVTGPRLAYLLFSMGRNHPTLEVINEAPPVKPLRFITAPTQHRQFMGSAHFSGHQTRSVPSILLPPWGAVRHTEACARSSSAFPLQSV